VVELGVITLQHLPVVEYQVKEIVVGEQILLVREEVEAEERVLLVDIQLEALQKFLRDLVVQE